MKSIRSGLFVAAVALCVFVVAVGTSKAQTKMHAAPPEAPTALELLQRGHTFEGSLSALIAGDQRPGHDFALAGEDATLPNHNLYTGGKRDHGGQSDIPPIVVVPLAGILILGGFNLGMVVNTRLGDDRRRLRCLLTWLAMSGVVCGYGLILSLYLY